LLTSSLQQNNPSCRTLSVSEVPAAVRLEANSQPKPPFAVVIVDILVVSMAQLPVAAALSLVRALRVVAHHLLLPQVLLALVVPALLQAASRPRLPPNPRVAAADPAVNDLHRRKRKLQLFFKILLEKLLIDTRIR
jgi:hypothetical protein